MDDNKRDRGSGHDEVDQQNDNNNVSKEDQNQSSSSTTKRAEKVNTTNGPRATTERVNAGNDPPPFSSMIMALVPYDPDPQTLLHLLQNQPGSLLIYISSLRQAVQQLQRENRQLESTNKRLRLRLRCQLSEVTERFSHREPIPLPHIPERTSGPEVHIPELLGAPEREESHEGTVSWTSGISQQYQTRLQYDGGTLGEAPSSLVSVLVPPPLGLAKSQTAPSQNVSSLNITPEATKPNSLAILPPEALPEPRAAETRDDGAVETIRSPLVASEQTANHTVSSEDISVAVNNVERNAVVEDEPQNCAKPDLVPSAVRSTVSTTSIPVRGSPPPVPLVKEEPTQSNTGATVASSDRLTKFQPQSDTEPSVYLSSRLSNREDGPEQTKSDPFIAENEDNTDLQANSDTMQTNNPPSSTSGREQSVLHPFLPFLYTTRRLHRVQQWEPEVDGEDNNPPAISTSWPVTAELSRLGCGTGLQSLTHSRRRNSCTDHVNVRNVNENRPSLFSLRTQLYFDAQMFEIHRRQLAAGRLSEEPELVDLEEENATVHGGDLDLLRTPLLPPSRTVRDHVMDSTDSLHVNVDSDDILNNADEEDLVDQVVPVGDDLALDESSSSSSSAESADGRGDGGSEPPSSTPSLTAATEEPTTEEPSTSRQIQRPQSPTPQSTTTPTQTATSAHTNLGGKYGNLCVLFRPRPPSGHRYVISVNEVNSRRKNETRLPSWVPTYAQRIECILHQVLDETENIVQTPPVTTDISADFNLVYARLRGDPPMRLLEFDESSDSEDSCIRSINATTKQRKSCLKVVSREGNVGESRPKNLSWSQHVYVAQIPAVQLPSNGDYDRNKTNSCPGIYYMGEFAIQDGGKPVELPSGQLQKFGGGSSGGRVLRLVQRVCHCFRCNSPPPQHVESTTDVRSGDGFGSNGPRGSFTCFDGSSSGAGAARAADKCPKFNIKWRRKLVVKGSSVRKKRKDANDNK